MRLLYTSSPASIRTTSTQNIFLSAAPLRAAAPLSPLFVRHYHQATCCGSPATSTHITAVLRYGFEHTVSLSVGNLWPLIICSNSSHDFNHFWPYSWLQSLTRVFLICQKLLALTLFSPHYPQWRAQSLFCISSISSLSQCTLLKHSGRMINILKLKMMQYMGWVSTAGSLIHLC